MGVEGVMKGYRPQVDWGGEGGSATIVMGGHNVKVATAGWRRRCIFIFLISLMLISIFNFIFTLYIMKKISFNAEGTGDLHITIGALMIDGHFFLNHEFSFSKLVSRPGNQLDLTAYYNVSAFLLDDNGNHEASFILDPDILAISTKGFKAFDSKGNFLFEVNEDGAAVGAKYFTVTGNEGATFNGSMQTPRLLGNGAVEFKIESKTRDVTATAGGSIQIEARDGDITIITLKDAIFSSSDGKIRFETPNLRFPEIPCFNESLRRRYEYLPCSEEDKYSSEPYYETQIPRPPTFDFYNIQRDYYDQDEIKVYQVCACPSGRLFLVSAEYANCEDDEDTCI